MRLAGKCAILFFGLSLQGIDGTGDFRKAHLPNISGGNAQGVQGIGGVKIYNAAKIILREIFRRVDPAPDQQHISYAVLQCRPVLHLNIQVIQFLQKAAFFIIMQLCEIVGHVVLHGVLCRREQRRGQIGCILQIAKAVFQRFDHSGRKLRAHGPNRHRL